MQQRQMPRMRTVHHVRDGAEIHRSYDEKEHRDSYRIHYMMIRSMFFQEGWPVFSPEPYTGFKLFL